MARPLIPFVQNGYYASRNWIPLVKGNGFTTSGGGEQEEVWETASGSVVTFDAIAAPLRQLSVAVEPVQNLNGYDNPWPAGGGKNKANFPVDASLPYSELITTVFDAGEDITVDSLVLSFFLENASFSNGAGAICDFKKNDGTHQYRVGGNYGIATEQTYTGRYSHAESNITFRYLNVYMGTDYIHFTSGKASIQLELNTSTPTDFSPYSNICPISGWNSVTVNRTGKNLLDFTDYSTWEDGYLRADGTPSGTAAVAPAYERCSPFIPIKGGQAYTLSYVFSGTLPSGSAASNNVCFYDAGKNLVGSRTSVGSATTVTATAPSAAAYMRFSIRTYNIAENYQLELGSTATAYEPYSGNEYTIQLGETVYGGTLDVLTGVLTVDRVMVTLDGTGIGKEASTWSTWEYVYYKMLTPIGRFVSVSTVPNIISNQTYAVSYNGIRNADKAGLISFTGNGGYLEWTSSEETLAEEQARLSLLPMQLVYELATPIELTLTPEQISTLQGTNNVWSDAGDVTVEYRAQ